MYIVKHENDIAQRSFLKIKEKKESKMISFLTAQLANVPQIIEQATKSREVILDVSKELATKIANGELEFVQKGVTGQAVGILRDSKTKKLFAQLPIKEIPIELGSSIATAGMTMKLQEVLNKLEELDNKINKVNRNFDLNRYAGVQSARDKYKLAILCKDLSIKKSLLQESLSQATNGKNLLLNQLYESKLKLEKSQEKTNIMNSMFNSKLHEDSDTAQVALENLNYLKESFSFQIASLVELKEYNALNYVVSDFVEIIKKDFSGDNALFLDGNLPPEAGNPFKYLSENVIESASEILKFIESNDELLDTHFIPSDLN